MILDQSTTLYTEYWHTFLSGLECNKHCVISCQWKAYVGWPHIVTWVPGVSLRHSCNDLHAVLMSDQKLTQLVIKIK